MSVLSVDGETICADRSARAPLTNCSLMDSAFPFCYNDNKGCVPTRLASSYNDLFADLIRCNSITTRNCDDVSSFKRCVRL